jgi:formate hydrogenlyase subunit 6/NADH:ubiquinone oxidoreductase subunit I
MDGRPQVGEDCISCLSCFHWCPQEAIWMSKAEEPMQRRFKYHHPDVTLQDILRQQEQ